MAKPDTLYDEEPTGEGPVECEECKELFDPEMVNMCPVCKASVCMYCWDEHMGKHPMYPEE